MKIRQHQCNHSLFTFYKIYIFELLHTNVFVAFLIELMHGGCIQFVSTLFLLCRPLTHHLINNQQIMSTIFSSPLCAYSSFKVQCTFAAVFLLQPLYNDPAPSGTMTRPIQCYPNHKLCIQSEYFPSPATSKTLPASLFEFLVVPWATYFLKKPKLCFVVVLIVPAFNRR